MSIRGLIADDQDIVRTGLTMLLDAQPEVEVVAAAADGRVAVSLARQLRPDVGLFDIRIPLMDGIEATRQLAGPGVVDPLPIVVITTFDLDEYVYEALRAGARGTEWTTRAADRTTHRPRGASAPHSRSRPHQQRDRRRAPHQSQLRLDPPGQPDAEARRA